MNLVGTDYGRLMEPDYTTEEIQKIRKDFSPKAAAIRANLDNTPAPNRLYHYTNVVALKSIIETQVLWFTDVRYLNDAEELDYPARLIGSVIESFISNTQDDVETELLRRFTNSFHAEGMIDLFTMSLSEEMDELSQWRGYGEGSGGVSVGLDVRHCSSNLPAALQLVRIEYDEAIQVTQIEDLVRAFLNLVQQHISMYEPRLHTFVIAECCRYFRAEVLGLAMRFKSRHWRSEREWRIVIGLTPDEKREHLRFRSGKLGLVPFLESSVVQMAGINYGKLPISEIVLGPNPYHNLANEAMLSFLRHHGYYHCEVTLSGVPLRA